MADKPVPGTSKRVNCPTCYRKVLAVFGNDQWVFPPHDKPTGGKCPTTSKSA